MARAIGIDLGTTYTVVGAIVDGRPKIIPNAEGQNLTPSVVAVTGEAKPLVGEPARSQAVANPGRTVFSIKRRMGSDYKVMLGEKEYTPEEISSLILLKVKNDAEDYLGERIDQAVITVPAYFNDRQRQATRQAGLLAGLDVIRIINEPTAAALAYGLGREDIHTILVWDLGGGTFDISILEIGEGIIEVKAVSGDTWLGGDDYDQKLMGYLAEEYTKATGIAFPNGRSSWQWLKEAAERAKIQLSSSLTTMVRFSWGKDMPEHRGLELEVTRAQLEKLTANLLQRMVIPTRQALKDAGLTAGDIHRVILVGGATRMPAVRALVRQILEKEPYRYINPDEVVAAGAAIHVGMLLGLIDKAVLLDVLPLSLGVETQGGLMARLIHRNTPLPASGAKIFTTAADNQTSMDIQVLQGERELAVDNISLGQFQLNGIPPAIRGTAKVEVSFEADVDGIVHVTAMDLLTDGEVKAKLASTQLLDPQEIDHLAQEARLNAERDREKRQGIEVGIEAENVIYAAENILEPIARPGAEALVDEGRKAILSVKLALASGDSVQVKQQSMELRNLLRRFTTSPSSPLSVYGEGEGGEVVH